MSTFDGVFFPYLFKPEGIELKIEKVHLDDKPAEPEIKEGTCDLTDLGDWSEAVLEVEVGFPAGLPRETVPPSERIAPPMGIAITCQCSPTRKRWQVPIDWNTGSSSGKAKIVLDHDVVQGAVVFSCLAFRERAQNVDDALAMDRSSRLAASRQWSVLVDTPPTRPGVGLEPQWVDFGTSKNPFLRERPELLFYLDTEKEFPRLLLNSGCDPDLRAVLDHEAPHGGKARVRNALFAAMAVPAWVSLVDAAHRSATVEDDGTIQPGWQRDVLRRFAVAAHPGSTPAAAIQQLRSDLDDPDGGRSIRDRLPAIACTLPEIRFQQACEGVTEVVG